MLISCTYACLKILRVSQKFVIGLKIPQNLTNSCFNKLFDLKHKICKGVEYFVEKKRWLKSKFKFQNYFVISNFKPNCVAGVQFTFTEGIIMYDYLESVLNSCLNSMHCK